MSETVDLIPVSDYKPASELTIQYNLQDTSRSLEEKLSYGKQLLADRVINALEEGYITITDLPILAKTIDLLGGGDTKTNPKSLLAMLSEKYEGVEE